MSQFAYASEEDRLLAQQEVKFARLDEERQRTIDAVSLQVQDEEERRIKLQQINDYYDGLKVQAAEQTAQRMIDISAKEAKAEETIQKQKQKALTDIQNALGDLATLMNTQSRKAFEVGKTAAIAQTIISTYSSAQKSYDSMAGIPYVGPVLGAAAAAAAIAAGIARVQAISKTQFGTKSAGVAAGGGTPNVGGGGIGIGGGVGRTAPATKAPAQTQTTTIYVNGVISTDQLLNELVPQALSNQLNNNDTVLFGPQSAQGQIMVGNV